MNKKVDRIDNVKATGNTDTVAWTIGDVYLNQNAVLANLESYDCLITRFTAGGLGIYSYRDISIAELTLCWQHAEFRCKCPESVHEAYIYFFAGRVNNGSYWEIHVYCPDCDCGYRIGDFQGLPYWITLKDILVKEIQEKKQKQSAK